MVSYTQIFINIFFPQAVIISLVEHKRWAERYKKKIIIKEEEEEKREVYIYMYVNGR
jgi:hypothetical protein